MNPLPEPNRSAKGTLRNRLYGALEPAAWSGPGLSPVNRVVCFLILIASLAGIGLIALPAGILAAALSDAFQRQKNEDR